MLVCRNSLCYITYLVRPTCGNNNSKVAVVTGASRGIGKAIAIEFAKSGYCIMINDFEKEEKLKSTVGEISRLVADDNHNTKVAYINGDVSQEQTCVYLMEQTINIFGRIDVLINNASIAEKMATREKNMPYHRFLLLLIWILPDINNQHITLHWRNMKLQTQV